MLYIVCDFDIVDTFIDQLLRKNVDKLYKILGNYITDSHIRTPWYVPLSESKISQLYSIYSVSFQVILAGALTGVQGEIRCKVLAALSIDKACKGTTK